MPRITARLKDVSGSRNRAAFALGRGGMAELPDPVALRILPDGAGFVLQRLDAAGASIVHTWHASLDAAKSAAASDYGIADDDWRTDR